MYMLLVWGYSNILWFLGWFSISVPFNLLSPCPNHSWIRVTRQRKLGIRQHWKILTWTEFWPITYILPTLYKASPFHPFPTIFNNILQFYNLLTQSFPFVCLPNLGHLMVHVYWQTVMTTCWEYLTFLWSCIIGQLCMDCQKWYVYSLIHTIGSLCHHGMLMYCIINNPQMSGVGFTQ